ncbi:DUF2155 domain-containing protein [Erythrobacter sanguineus]|uniref:DUF2155 domain-containing protein n=1 Tax=Erythrobacter sanguineus TaxID=198312 RepID=A0A1M7ST80_9SPHN|nr:DUF2155 domain-containing protein [Erythrobacter sanguineus]SHN61574.1 hypothetical protein SAMN02745193_02300 [Erythrobacter sanguineus]
MRLSRLAAPLACALVLAACDNGAAPEAADLPLDQAEPAAAPAAAPAPGEADDDGATPMDQRVATLGLLNKRNNVSQDITLKPGETAEIGPVIIRLSACERTAPWELPQETGAFVQVDIRERGQGQHARVFSGWLFRESPSLNVVEHPVYDVWVKDCTIRWPGEAAAAAPAPSPTPSPAP